MYTSPCSGVVRQQHILASIDRADFNGFFDYITAHSKYKPGVYSSQGVWQSIFAGTSYGSIPNTYEWTYEPETTNYIGNAPFGFCLKSGRVRAVLRRSDVQQPVCPHVAVVRRRWGHQWHRRL